MLELRGLPKIARPGEENAPALRELKVPSTLNELSGKKLGEKLQEIAAWKAYADQEVGIARSIYSLVSVEKTLDPRNEDKRRAYGFVQAYMKRLETYSDALKIMYDALSRQVAIREQRIKVEGGKRFT